MDRVAILCVNITLNRVDSTHLIYLKIPKNLEILIQSCRMSIVSSCSEKYMKQTQIYLSKLSSGKLRIEKLQKSNSRTKIFSVDLLLCTSAV